MSRYSVDRLENGVVIIEYDGSFLEVKDTELPSSVKEGDILCKNSDGRYEIDVAKTREVKAKLNSIQNSLFDK